MRARMNALAFVSTVVLLHAADAQPASLNFLTDLETPFPPGCLSTELPTQPGEGQRLLVSEHVDVPAVHSDTRNATVHIGVWRVACADDGFSVVLVRLRQVAGDAPVLVPEVLVNTSNFGVLPYHEGRLLALPGSGPVSASGGAVSTIGDTWLLAVNPVSVDGTREFLPGDYNREFTLSLTWWPYASDPSNLFFRIAAFDPVMDLPQFQQPVLNGRYSGQWVLRGAPRQGLVLTVAEHGDRNYVFAILFTYIEGQPYWLAGNTAPAAARPGPVSIQMSALEDGAFIADPLQPAPGEVRTLPAGRIEIEAIDCNRIRVSYDFSPLKPMAGVLEMDRLVRVAGYDCNPWA